MMFRVVFWDILPCKMIADNSEHNSCGILLPFAEDYTVQISLAYILGVWFLQVAVSHTKSLPGHR
jgi:hypothetical protein